jgi:predicted DNA-binding transcriptional regulator YafY
VPLPARNRPPKLGRPPGHFTQKKRLDKLRNALDDAPIGLTIEELSRVLSVTPRSVRRYLRAFDETREGEDFEKLDSVEIKRGGAYRWRIKPSERGRAVALRRAQAYAILATRRALDVLRGSALHDDVELAFSQIEKIAETPFRGQGKAQISGEQNLEARFFVLPPTSRSYASRGEDLDELFRAVADLRILRFRPRARPGEPRAERVVFQPYAMVAHRGSIVVLGARAATGELEVVPFDSMTDLRASEAEHFELPPSFEVSSFLHGEFGVAPPAPTGRARAIVEFDARAADDVRSKRVHPLQKTATSADGRVRVQIPLVNVDAVVAWVLSYGDAARVVDPPELASRVAGILERAASRYRA